MSTPRIQLPAFSMLELTIALALGTAMIGGFLFFYQVMIKHRDTVMEELNEDMAIHATMNQIASELQSVVLDEYLKLSIEGDEDSIRILHSTLPDARIWREQEATDDPSEFLSSDLRISSYQLLYEDSEDGFEQELVGLQRSLQKIHTAERLLQDNLFEIDEETEDPTLHKTLISEAVKFLQFRYWDGQTWTNTWSDAQAPVAIEVIMGFNALPENMDLQSYLDNYPVKLRLIHVRDRAGVDSPQVRGLGGASR